MKNNIISFSPNIYSFADVFSFLYDLVYIVQNNEIFPIIIFLMLWLTCKCKYLTTNLKSKKKKLKKKIPTSRYVWERNGWVGKKIITENRINSTTEWRRSNMSKGLALVDEAKSKRRKKTARDRWDNDKEGRWKLCRPM